MFEVPYDNEIIRKAVVGFGALFSNVKVPRKDKNGNLIQTVAVPISYGPKEKIFVKLNQDPSLTNHVYTILPRMAFEIVDYSYDPSRRTNKNNQIRCYKNGTVTGVYSPVPYNLTIQMHVLTKGAMDGFNIIEQILPIFGPDYTMTIDMLESMNITQDIPIVLDSVSLQDDYEGDFSTRRFVTHTLTFTLSLSFYGPVKTNGVITRTETTIDTYAQHVSTGNLATGEVTSDFWLEDE